MLICADAYEHEKQGVGWYFHNGTESCDGCDVHCCSLLLLCVYFYVLCMCPHACCAEFLCILFTYYVILCAFFFLFMCCLYAPQITLFGKNELTVTCSYCSPYKKLLAKQEHNYHSNFLITPGLHLLITIQSTRRVMCTSFSVSLLSLQCTVL